MQASTTPSVKATYILQMAKVKSIEERQLRRSSLAKGFSTSINTFELETTMNEESTEEATGKQTPAREDIMISLFHRLKDLLEREMLQWWDILLLQKYLEFKRIPRGLRITKICTFLDLDLREKWIQSLREYNQKWLHFIITQRERNLSAIRAELHTLQEELSTFSDVSSFESWDHKVNRQITDYETNLISKKSGKFEQDRLDYLNDREFNWKRPNNRESINRNRNENRSKNRKGMINEQSSGHNTYGTQFQGKHQKEIPRNHNIKAKSNRNRISNKTKTDHKKDPPVNQTTSGESHPHNRPHHQQYSNTKNQQNSNLTKPNQVATTTMNRPSVCNSIKASLPEELSTENPPMTRDPTNIIITNVSENSQLERGTSIIPSANGRSILPLLANGTPGSSPENADVVSDIDSQLLKGIPTYNPFSTLADFEANSTSISDITPPLFFLEQVVATLGGSATNLLPDPLSHILSTGKKIRKREEEHEEEKEEERDTKRGRL